MFKKIEAWVLYLTILIGLLFSIFFGVLVRQELVGAIKLGPVSKAALFIAEIPMNLKLHLQGTRVLSVEDRFPEISGFVGKGTLEETYLLLSRYDGDLEEGVVELVDLRTFKILHTWNPNIDLFNSLVDTSRKEFEYLERDNNNSINKVMLTQIDGV